jgi:hypothetical protein
MPQPHELLIVWDEDREIVMCGAHEQLGHKGTELTYRQAAMRFWWPSMHKDITAWVHLCHQCQLFSRQHVTIPVNPSSPTQLFRRICIDIMYMEKASGYRGIVIAREWATGYPEARMLKKINMCTVTQFLYKEIIC